MPHRNESQESDPWDGSIETVQVDWQTYDSPTAAVIALVADATGRDPTALPALHEAIDTDSLDRLVTGRTVSGESSVRITFIYAGVTVAVESDGKTIVHPDLELTSKAA